MDNKETVDADASQTDVSDVVSRDELKTAIKNRDKVRAELRDANRRLEEATGQLKEFQDRLAEEEAVRAKDWESLKKQSEARVKQAFDERDLAMSELNKIRNELKEGSIIEGLSSRLGLSSKMLKALYKQVSDDGLVDIGDITEDALDDAARVIREHFPDALPAKSITAGGPGYNSAAKANGEHRGQSLSRGALLARKLSPIQSKE